ncbi:hypothetical protein [Streptomyces griseofuscus]|uniref:hypothetical protein n=1 Tax=Streptomyces griseofuscus TaxID=146922 RepID=UPI0033D34494
MADAFPDRTGAADRLRRCMTVLGHINEEEHDRMAAMLVAWVKAGRPLREEPYVAELFAEIVEDGRRTGELREDVIPQQVGNVLRDIYLGTLYRWFREAENEPEGRLEQELMQASELLLNGIATRPCPHPSPSDRTRRPPDPRSGTLWVEPRLRSSGDRAPLS